MNERTECGVPRTNCSCETCIENCRVMPGFLIPEDLDRLVPVHTSMYEWAEQNLLASPGAVAIKDGEMFRIPTLVPATKSDGSCIHLSPEGKCGIHDNAPFGCAFFDCGPEPRGLVERGMARICEAMDDITSKYAQLWIHLSFKGLEQRPPEELRAKMRIGGVTVATVEEAEAEVERLKALGWKQEDFANALKQLLGESDGRT